MMTSIPLRLSKRQSMSPQTVLLRTTLTRTITIYRIMSVERVIGMGCLYIFERCLHSYLGRKRMVVSQVLMAGNLFISLFIICERFRTVGERGRISDEVTQQCN